MKKFLCLLAFTAFTTVISSCTADGPDETKTYNDNIITATPAPIPAINDHGDDDKDKNTKKP